MNLKKGENYLLTFEVNNSQLTYLATIIDFDNTFITFIDKHNKQYSYNIKFLVRIEEV